MTTSIHRNIEKCKSVEEVKNTLIRILSFIENENNHIVELSFIKDTLDITIYKICNLINIDRNSIEDTIVKNIDKKDAGFPVHYYSIIIKALCCENNKPINLLKELIKIYIILQYKYDIIMNNY